MLTYSVSHAAMLVLLTAWLGWRGFGLHVLILGSILVVSVVAVRCLYHGAQPMTRRVAPMLARVLSVVALIGVSVAFGVSQL